MSFIDSACGILYTTQTIITHTPTVENVFIAILNIASLVTTHRLTIINFKYTSLFTKESVKCLVYILYSIIKTFLRYHHFLEMSGLLGLMPISGRC